MLFLSASTFNSKVSEKKKSWEDHTLYSNYAKSFLNQYYESYSNVRYLLYRFIDEEANNKKNITTHKKINPMY